MPRWDNFLVVDVWNGRSKGHSSSRQCYEATPAKGSADQRESGRTTAPEEATSSTTTSLDRNDGNPKAKVEARPVAAPGDRANAPLRSVAVPAKTDRGPRGLGGPNASVHPRRTGGEGGPVIQFPSGVRQEPTPGDRTAYLESHCQELRRGLATHRDVILKQDETIELLRFELRTQGTTSNHKIARLEQVNKELRAQLDDAQRTAEKTNKVHKLIHLCESEYGRGRIDGPGELLLNEADTINEVASGNQFISDWYTEFTNRYVTRLEKTGDEALVNKRLADAGTTYYTALRVSRSPPDALLAKWAGVVSIDRSVHDVLHAANHLQIERATLCRVICDALARKGRLHNAIECFRQMTNGSESQNNLGSQYQQWEMEFRRWCAQALERLGDIAKDSQKREEAIEHYSHALSFNPTNSNDILLKKSNEVIELEPSSHQGYEQKHTALHGMGRYSDAFEVFKTMLSKIEQSSDPDIRKLCDKYVDATSIIQKIVQQTIRDMPRELIDTVTGRLYDKTQQAAAFEELPTYDELRSSMTTRSGIDNARIREKVKQFYRYVMLSHKWQLNEPTFQQVKDTPVYELPVSPIFSKLQKFCRLACSLNFQWAWSDTCCVNQLDRGVQQESLVAMFKWYRGSSLTIVHLLGVLSELQENGHLWRSIWNTRGWTYQEYLASRVVQFYTEDWKPYLGLDISNHKESPKILLEMEQAMNFATKELATLQPGLDRAREKLYLASGRHTTREEDMAYSLFGVFNVALRVIYGEGNQAVGRLLEHIVTRSADVTLLAWTGTSGSQHSYLPVDLTVYNQIVAPHLPPLIATADMNDMVMALRTSVMLDSSLAISLYERLCDLPPLSLVAGRLRLPGIVFPLTNLSPLSESATDTESDNPVYRATTPMLGEVLIETTTELSGSLLLIHPWISPLLDQDFSCGEPQVDLATRALRLVVRLRQPFGALLLAPLARAQYRRVATDSMIRVRVREETSLRDLMDGVRTVDIQ